MTAVPKSPRISELRELFRNLTAFQATFEATGMEEIHTPLGNTWSLWDLEYLYRATERLTQRQRQAITLCLVHNVRERDAARAMGLKETNPVMMYATLGLQRLLDMIDSGELERFNRPKYTPELLRQRHMNTLRSLADEIKSRITIVRHDCWVYPNRGARPPKLLLKSARYSSGLVAVSPMQIMYEVHIGPVPPGCSVEHTTEIPPASISCANPEHGDLLISPERKAQIQAMAAQYVRSIGRA